VSLAKAPISHGDTCPYWLKDPKGAMVVVLHPSYVVSIHPDAYRPMGVACAVAVWPGQKCDPVVHSTTDARDDPEGQK